uniref:F-box domain-containing protein n=1 Tax=Caenorhabditis tropicalis TaxID=1561998 RepID=A0A1I7TGW6_9PELO
MPPRKRNLSLLSIECVLEYCKADLRILLSLRSPLIRRIESNVLLKIEKIVLKPFGIQINETEFRLETIRKLPNSRPFGYFQCDLDDYGIPIEDKEEEELTPGDIRIESENKKYVIPYPNLELLEFCLSVLDRDQMSRKWSKYEIPDPINMDYCSSQMGQYLEFCPKKRKISVEDKEDLVYEYEPFRPELIDMDELYIPKTVGPMVNIFKPTLTCTEKRTRAIEQLQCQIVPLRLRRDKKTPEFKCYLQLTVISPYGNRLEILDYGQKRLHVAMKYLNERIMGGRKRIQVEKMEIGREGGVLRLPKDLKFSLNYLKIVGNGIQSLENIKTILTESSFPLNTVECYSNLLFYPYEKEIQKAKKRILPAAFERSAYKYDLLNLKNPHVHMPECLMTVDELIYFSDAFIRVRVRTEEIGALFTFGITSEEYSNHLMTALSEFPTAKWTAIPDIQISPLFPKYFIIPLPSESTELFLFGVRKEKENVLWTLHMKVIKIGLTLYE